jgi:hypothetical protein
MVNRLITQPRPSEGHDSFISRCTAAGGGKAECENLWNDAHGISDPPLPGGKGVSLRPDPGGLLQAERRSWSRAIAARVLATSQRGDPYKIVKAAWPRDDRAHMIVRAPMTPTTTSGAWTWDPVIAFRSLAPSSAALRLFELGLALNLTGASTIRIPSVAGRPVQPVFVSEGSPVPALQWNFNANIVLGPARKILMLSAVTGEIEAATPATASAVIGRILSDVANRGIDATAFGTAAADATKPAGLLHNVVPIAAATAGPDAMTDDLANLVGAIGTAGIDPSGAVYVCGPREASIIKTKVGPKFDSPILTTIDLPAKAVACFAPAGVISGYQDPPQIETSIEAAIHFEDTTPLDISSPGSPPTVAAPVKSAFQTNLIVIRVRANLAWAVASGAAQVISAVNW